MHSWWSLLYIRCGLLLFFLLMMQSGRLVMNGCFCGRMVTYTTISSSCRPLIVCSLLPLTTVVSEICCQSVDVWKINASWNSCLHNILYCSCHWSECGCNLKLESLRKIEICNKIQRWGFFGSAKDHFIGLSAIDDHRIVFRPAVLTVELLKYCGIWPLRAWSVLFHKISDICELIQSALCSGFRSWAYATNVCGPSYVPCGNSVRNYVNLTFVGIWEMKGAL